MIARRFLRGFIVFALLTTSSLVVLSCAQAGESSAPQANSTTGGEENLDAQAGKPAEDGSPDKLDETKSYAFYVGKDLTSDGSVLLGGTGEEPSSHWLEIVPRQQHPPGEMIEVGVTEDATIPGEITEIPQVEETYKYISMDYSEWAGFPAPLTNGGMNEYQVAGRDVWSPSREELVEMTPTPQRGPQYSDLARIAMERAKTAREAAEIVGGLIDEYGYSTYGGNTHIFADPNEGWIVKEMAGGKGLWVAERLGPDEVRVAYPGYINPIPREYIDFENLSLKDNPEFLTSDNFVSFAAEQGWYDPDTGMPFDVFEIYGDQSLNLEEGPKLMSPKEVERELSNITPVTVDEMMEMVRDPRISDDEAGYGQVAHLRDTLEYQELGLLWVAPTGSVTAPFIPWHMGAQQAPPEYRQHRYLTKDAASTFMDERYALQEATRFAGRVFKQLMYYTCSHPETFLPEVTRELETFEAGMLAEQAAVEQRARELYQAGQVESARQYLTEYSQNQALEGLRLGEVLVTNVGQRTQDLYGIPEPPEDEDINLNEDDEELYSIDCLAVPGVDADEAGDVPADQWRTAMPGVGSSMAGGHLPETGGP